MIFQCIKYYSVLYDQWSLAMIQCIIDTSNRPLKQVVMTKKDFNLTERHIAYLVRR